MRVTRLEVFGFKSFMERLVLPLEGGITGVVGPNGCGKSNIVDALRWVLGETRAKNLRGGILEDVIFNGTDKLRPLGLAEVSLTLRATGPDFFSDLMPDESELVDLEASAEEPAPIAVASERESSEEDRPRLTVIQGNLGQGTETRLLECDIPLPKQKKPEANATLLTRFAWLKSANEVQVTRRLYRSGESEFFVNRVPCRLKDLKDLFRAVGLGAKAYTIVAQGEVGRIITAKPEERRLILEEAAGVVGFRDKITAASRRLEETELNISRIDDIVKEVAKQVVMLKRQAARAESRAELKSQIALLERMLFQDKIKESMDSRVELEARRADVLREEESAELELSRVQAEEESARGGLMQIDVEGDALRSQMESIQEEINARARQRGERTSRMAELRAFILSSDAELKKLRRSGETFAARRTALSSDAASLDAEAGALTMKIAELKGNFSSSVNELREKSVESNNFLRSAEIEASELKAGFLAAKAELKVVEEQLVALDPVAELRASSGAESSEPLLIDGIAVPAELRSALQAVLGEKAGFIVSRAPLKLASEVMGRAGGADLSARGVGVIGSRQGLDASVANETNFAFPRLYDLLTIDESTRLIAFELLRDVYLAESYEDAIKFFSEISPGSNLTIVTKAGEVVSSHMFYSLRHEGGIVHLKHRARELRTISTELEAKLSEAVERVQALKGSSAALAADLARAETELREREKAASSFEETRAGVIGRSGSLRTSLSQVDEDMKVIAADIERAESKRAELESEELRLREELAAALPEDETRLQERIKELRASYSALDGSRREGREKLSELAEAFSEARRRVDGARSRSSDLALEIQKLGLEEQNLRDRVLAEYGTELWAELSESAPMASRLGADEFESAREEVSKLKARIIREGDVDPESIGRYQEENTRLEELESQRADLKSAADTLKKTIEKLTETSVERFLTVFKGVRSNFSKLVPKLFGGGKADLELLDPQNPLESGVEIIARPPGKKLKSLELLSGGEKALCATALIFAMFLERPSPLCVLDEVDAPLDEANLARFLAMIREMSSKTQFIMITHDKQSMTAADQLVGVTMQEPGASKILTVSLQEAYSQVA